MHLGAELEERAGIAEVAVAGVDLAANDAQDRVDVARGDTNWVPCLDGRDCRLVR